MAYGKTYRRTVSVVFKYKNYLLHCVLYISPHVVIVFVPFRFCVFVNPLRSFNSILFFCSYFSVVFDYSQTNSIVFVLMHRLPDQVSTQFKSIRYSMFAIFHIQFLLCLYLFYFLQLNWFWRTNNNRQNTEKIYIDITILYQLNEIFVRCKIHRVADNIVYSSCIAAQHNKAREKKLHTASAINTVQLFWFSIQYHCRNNTNKHHMHTSMLFLNKW